MGCALLCIPIIYPFCVGRLINGFVVGVNSAVIPIILNQFCPIILYGVVGIIFSIMINAGILVT